LLDGDADGRIGIGAIGVTGVVGVTAALKGNPVLGLPTGTDGVEEKPLLLLLT